MSGQIVTETVSDKESGTRLDRWVKRRVPVTQGQIEKMLLYKKDLLVITQ